MRETKPLSHYARPCSGYNPYEVGKGRTLEGTPHTKETVQTKPYHSNEKLGEEWKPEIIGRNLGRYSISISGKRWIKYGHWLAAPREANNFIGKRILVQEITGGKDKRIIAAYCDQELYHSRDVIPIKFESEFPHPFYILGIINSKLITWYHHRRNPKAQKGLFPKVLVSDLENLPIKESSNQNTYSIVVDYIICKKKHSKDSSFFERLIDAMVYELYLPDEIKAADCEVLKHIAKLPEFKDDWSDEKKLAVIEKVYKELSAPKHPVTIAMEKMQEIPEVKIIEGRDKE